MKNPYGITDGQMAAYAAQIAEEKAARAALPGGEVKEFIAWFRKWAWQEAIIADRIKFGAVQRPEEINR